MGSLVAAYVRRFLFYMNRTIKFRAWFPAECFQDNQARMFNKACISDEGKVMHLEGGWDYTGDEEKAIPMQFTGLKDKYGKEIYEGDIVKWEYEFNVIDRAYKQRRETTTVVEFENGLFKTGNGDVEVIGNIYENPELIRGGAKNPLKTQDGSNP